ncbi:MAG TPA: aminotransferase class I/II-fold pyridoxal phosphate-dependent enzyme, partial [Thermomonospora sp.]|nr:aminotransferase class I/II-fold pyridoxal phosphate-dependent enzyme [Thermomonospora sp.]
AARGGAVSGPGAGGRLARCVIAGGRGEVGSLFARLLAGAGRTVVAVDVTDPPATRDAVHHLRGDITDPHPALRAQLAAADLVMLAVPEDTALAAAGTLPRLLRPGTLLAETLSVKGRVAEALRPAAGRLEIVGLNPMFAPRLGVTGRPVVAVPLCEGPRTRELLRLVEDGGGRVVVVGPGDHDRLTGAAQALTHAAVLGFGLGLAGLDVDVKELGRIAPPPHATMLALLARIVSGTPEVYWDVQATPQAAGARAALADGLRRIAALVEDGDRGGFDAALGELGDLLGPDLPRYRDLCARLFASTGPASRRTSWVDSRVSRTSDALDRAFDTGLTGHVITGRSGKTVRLADGGQAVEFVSCSYLGLEEHPDLVAAAHEALERFGVHFSSSRNRMRPHYLGELEDLLSEVYRGSRVVVLTSVGNVHLGLLPLLGSGALPGYPVAECGAHFLVERTAHASMQVIRGILEQVGPVSRFDLADPESLPRALREAAAARRTPVVLVDGVGSMGGLIDVAGLREAIEPYGGHLYVDDAHGVSIAGPLGAGYAFEAFGDRLPPNVVIAGSLSKAFGGAGGFAVVPGEGDVRVLRKFANPLVFGHSILLPMLAADVAAARLHVNGQVAVLQERLWRTTARFDELTGGTLVNAGLRSPVRGALYDTEEEAFAAAARLREAGVLILPAFFPTVARGTGLVRFALSSLHEPAHLETAARALQEAR